MKQTGLLSYCAIALLLGAVASAPAETAQLKAKPGSKVQIDGDSTMHAWTVQGSLIGGSAEVGEGFPLEPGQAAEPGTIEASVSAFIPITSLKSVKDGKPYSTKMDEIMHEKLGSPAHKYIAYHLNELALKEAAKDADSPYVFESKGKLAICGVTNDVTLPVEVTPMGEGKVKFATSTPLKMSDFNIKGPELTVLGIGIKTDDNVTVSIEWNTARVE